VAWPSCRSHPIGPLFDAINLYHYNDMGGEPQFGLMADEVAKVVPHAVAKLPYPFHDFDGVDYAEVFGHMARAGVAVARHADG